jgi:hypothetical protein
MTRRPTNSCLGTLHAENISGIGRWKNFSEDTYFIIDRAGDLEVLLDGRTMTGHCGT